jgi:hypothetical protein
MCLNAYHIVDMQNTVEVQEMRRNMCIRYHTGIDFLNTNLQKNCASFYARL